MAQSQENMVQSQENMVQSQENMVQSQEDVAMDSPLKKLFCPSLTCWFTTASVSCVTRAKYLRRDLTKVLKASRNRHF
jgi:hypothetical protein